MLIHSKSVAYFLASCTRPEALIPAALQQLQARLHDKSGMAASRLTYQCSKSKSKKGSVMSPTKTAVSYVFLYLHSVGETVAAHTTMLASFVPQQYCSKLHEESDQCLRKCWAFSLLK